MYSYTIHTCASDGSHTPELLRTCCDPPTPGTTPNVLDPINQEIHGLAKAAVCANVARTLFEGIYQPFKLAFGDLPCTEWDLRTNSGAFPAPSLPRYNAHFQGGDLPIDMQAVVNYVSLPNLRGAALAGDRWDTLENWLSAYPQVGPAYNPAINVLDQECFHRLVYDIRSREARAASRTAPSKPLMPSVSVSEVRTLYSELGSNQAGHDAKQLERKRRAIPLLVRYMLGCCGHGATRFWVFAASWNTGTPADTTDGRNISAVAATTIRRSTFELCDAFNKAYRARIPMRNRMWRGFA